ncbi:MAG: hypothetical protein WD059_13390 [Balneolaceae bacterium]
MKKFLCLLILLSVMYSFAQAQPDESKIYNAKQVGLTFSTLGGAGIHYIAPSSEKDNMKFTGIYIYSDNNSEKSSYFSLGVEYQRDLIEGEDRRGYVAIGGHIDNDLSEGLYFEENSNRQSYFSIGTGLGLDFGSTDKGIILNAHLTYQLTTGLAGTDRTRIGLGGGVGLGFNF